jgi:hypothetical protein
VHVYLHFPRMRGSRGEKSVSLFCDRRLLQLQVVPALRQSAIEEAGRTVRNVDEARTRCILQFHSARLHEERHTHGHTLRKEQCRNQSELQLAKTFHFQIEEYHSPQRAITVGSNACLHR